MKSKILILLFIALNISRIVVAKDIYFQFKTGEYGLSMLPFKVNIDNFNLNEDSLTIIAFRIDGMRIIPLHHQLETGEANYLWLMPDKRIPANTLIKIKIEILNTYKSSESENNIVCDNDLLTMLAGNKKILSYKHSYTASPVGVDSIFGKSAYIHPLCSPGGNIMTRIQPDDHYHHYGIWNPWTKIKIDNMEKDLWNLIKRQGTVRFAGLISKTYGELFSSMSLMQEHVVYDSIEPESVILNEKWKIRSFPVMLEGKKCWMIDMNIELNNALDKTIELEKYRYGGGIGFRATEDWTNENSEVLTSEGKTRENADASHARWCKVEGDFENGTRSGIVFCSHPGNRSFPEPMRVWPIDANNGRGDVFFQFCPIRHKSWFITPGEKYILKYRMLVYDDELSTETAELVWQHFAYPIKTEQIEK